MMLYIHCTCLIYNKNKMLYVFVVLCVCMLLACEMHACLANGIKSVICCSHVSSM